MFAWGRGLVGHPQAPSLPEDIGKAMLDRLTRLRDLYQTPAGRKMVRYTATSVICSVISVVVLAIVYGVLRLWS
ncbi:MAG: hypothetical protein ACRD6W_11250, partial [Nitrososphaerales archaeon]